MLVIENRDGAPAIAKDLDCFLKEAIARILYLSFRSFRIIAVFTDNHHPVDGELVRALGERLPDSRIDFHTRKAPGALAAQIVGSGLIHIERYQLHRRMVVRST